MITDASCLLAYVNNIVFKHPFGTKYRYRNKNKTIKLKVGRIYYLGKKPWENRIAVSEPEHGKIAEQLLSLSKRYKKPVVIIAEFEDINPHRLDHDAKIHSWEPVFHRDDRVPGFDAYIQAIGKEELCLIDGKPCEEEDREPSTYKLIIKKGKTKWLYAILVNPANIKRMVKEKEDPLKHNI